MIGRGDIKMEAARESTEPSLAEKAMSGGGGRMPRATASIAIPRNNCRFTSAGTAH